MGKLIVLVLGILLGIGCTLALQNPRKVERTARESVAQMHATIERERRDRCVRDYLDATHCFQHLGAAECDTRIVQRCGLPH